MRFNSKIIRKLNFIILSSTIFYLTVNFLSAPEPVIRILPLILFASGAALPIFLLPQQIILLLSTLTALGAIASVHDSFTLFNWFDNLMHFSVSLGLYLSFYYVIKRYRPMAKIYTAIIVFSLGLFWELYEFFIDNITGKNYQTLPDTLNDLGLAIAGCTAGIVLFKVFKN